MDTYASAERLAAEVKKLLEAGKIAEGEFPKDRQGVDYRCRRHNVPFREEKAKGGRGGMTRLYQVSAIPGLPPHPARHRGAVREVA